MANNLTCVQVGALLSFYIEGKLSLQLTQFVEEHLAICPSCKAKYEALKEMLASLKEVHAHIDNVKAVKSANPQNAEINDDENLTEALKTNLSAYIDNELSDDENLKVRKAIISNSKARDEFEKINSLKKLLHESFEKVKNECKEDYSKLIFRRIDLQEEVYGHDSFGKVVALFILIFAAFTVTAVLIFGV